MQAHTRSQRGPLTAIENSQVRTQSSGLSRVGYLTAIQRSLISSQGLMSLSRTENKEGDNME